MRRGDNAPIGHTCPIIDDVITQIHSLYLSSEAMSKPEYTSFEILMEKIRSANTTLREWGNEQCNLAQEYENDLDNEKRKGEDLQDEVDSLKSEIKELEKQLSEI